MGIYHSVVNVPVNVLRPSRHWLNTARKHDSGQALYGTATDWFILPQPGWTININLEFVGFLGALELISRGLHLFSPLNLGLF